MANGFQPIRPKTVVDHERPMPVIEVNLLEVASLLMRRSRLILGVTGVVTLIVAVVMLLTPNQYTSRASILPSGGGEKIGGLLGLASTMGFGTVGTTDENSSALYPTILRSDRVRDGVLAKQYAHDKGESHTVRNLSNYFGIADQNRLRTALAEITSIGADKKLGVISISVSTDYPAFSQIVLEEYLVQLEDYLLHKRRSQALQSERYLQKQQQEGLLALEKAEDKLRGFMQTNRNWSTSTDPNLQTELARLRRDTELHSQTYLLLTQQLEIARLDARKDIPIVRILDEPSLPSTKSAPRRTLAVLLAALVSLATMTLVVVTGHLIGQGLRQSRDFSLARLKQDFAKHVPGSRRILKLVTIRHNKLETDPPAPVHEDIAV